MGFFDWLLKLFGVGKKKEPEPLPAPMPEPPRTQLPPAAPAPAPSEVPTAPPAPEPAAFSLDALRAQDTAKVTPAQIDDVAARLGVEPEAIRAVVAIESAGQGFGPDGRPLILFEPVIFSALTDHKFDAGNPKVSQATAQPGALGNTQADRWAKLTEAFGLDKAGALMATNWGLFQTSGQNYQPCGFADVFAFVSDSAQSETRQLAAFEQFIRSKDLMDELRNQDWEGFARIYHGVSGAAKYGQFLQDAYVKEKQKSAGGAAYLDSLVAKNASPLTPAEIEAAAARMSVEPACVRAVLKVESKGSGFGADGRPLILYEPHIFSRLTDNQYDATHPTVSYKTWKERPYPKTQADRYKQLAEAYALDAEAALSSASWGLFQIMGMNYAACGFSSASAFVSDMAQSEANMLKSFEAFVRKNAILDELQRKDWAGFARVYNGPGQVDTYAKLLEDAYNSAKASV
jgi:hypothetical protein